jgi:hypothetical protein
MYNLSELIKTDCYIDCGTNEKLREVVGKLGIAASITQRHFGIMPDEMILIITDDKYSTTCGIVSTAIPLTQINIDL